jgi:hypothetical protein
VRAIRSLAVRLYDPQRLLFAEESVSRLRTRYFAVNFITTVCSPGSTVTDTGPGG